MERGTRQHPHPRTVRALAAALDLTEGDRGRLLAAATRGPAAETDPVTAARVPVLPAQLPPDVPGFTARRRELAQLDALLAEAGERPATVIISAVSGTAGVGKTALAVHWAHQVASQFPDGQLYVDLRGFDPNDQLTGPAEAIRGFLDALRITPERIPDTLAAQTALYRSLLAGKRLLILLDNARDAAQVRPMLPGAAGCLVVVTSRNQLPGLVVTEGAIPITLDLLSPTDACELLARRIGTARTAAEPAVVDEIVSRCAQLPLALAVVAARAAMRPRLALAVITAELRGTEFGLDAFASRDPAIDVRVVFSWSYQALSAAAARLFRLLGLHPGRDAATPAIASLVGIDAPRVRPLLDELVHANLVRELPAARYACHDLLHAYAVELAHTFDAEAERRAAVRRLLDHYLHTAYAGARLLFTDLQAIPLGTVETGVAVTHCADYAQALSWFTAEHTALVAAVHQAAAGGFDAHAWQLAATLVRFCERRGYWHDWVATQRIAVDAADRLADRAAQARAHHGLARAYGIPGRYDDAHPHLRQALKLFEQLGDVTSQAFVHDGLCWLLGRQGRHREALDHAGRSLDLRGVTGDRRAMVAALNNIGWCHAKLGNYEQAMESCRQSLALSRELGDADVRAPTLDSLGYIHRQLGEYEQAIACYRSVLDLYLDLGDRCRFALTLNSLADTYHAAGQTDAARDAWQEALQILDDLDHPDAEQVRTKLHQWSTSTQDAR